jgi:phage shock protein PspC (stress-responsive transcriptional regulator)
MKTILSVMLVFGVMSLIGYVLYWMMIDNDPFD